ncbi:MAG: invasion associated locus B family protein [Shimia sp.]|uniref:invasion associated locus B family protein n=1 Tax=Shimia sp. TaxID=1954381 RepID=UPI0025CBA402|nr:invasion associated locus B family protein [Shimia sp.]MCH2066272.1 invasion associated locus B family protein [Shimia sp.]
MRWLFALTLAATPLAAQDQAGNDRPSNWRVTHHAIHDLWNTLCDERDENGTLAQRCYIRRVDVFSPQPNFAAQFFFLTQSDDDRPEIEFGLELGTLTAPGNFRIERDGTSVWHTNRVGCLTGTGCTFDGDAAETLLAEMRTGGDFRFTFRDRHGASQDLTWPLTGFEAAFAYYRAQLAKRGLSQP